METSKEDIQEFIAILEREFNEKLSEDEARLELDRLLTNLTKFAELVPMEELEVTD